MREAATAAGERYYGVDIAADGALVVAARARAGQPAAPATPEDGALRLARLAERLF
jgi:hypothetical protein